MSEFKLTTFSATGAATGDRSVAETLFGRDPHMPLMHQALVRQLANGRAGTHSTKTRAEVRGGGRKPWKQKGTGRARQGSIRASQWVGGGVAFGPKPRSYEQDMNRQDRRIALASAVSVRKDASHVIDAGIEPKTKAFSAALKAMGLNGKKVLVVAGTDEFAIRRASNNLANIRQAEPENLSIHALLWSEVVLYTPAALESLEKRFANV
ncbi:MAG: 50S ribosomal protein L4 [Candidatus Sericytochromatia bacterium]|nr:50S ribosomal protein L4 [Candidatus Sericytochromatia bacterium]